jgi:hypothetical protein
MEYFLIRYILVRAVNFWKKLHNVGGVLDPLSPCERGVRYRKRKKLQRWKCRTASRDRRHGSLGQNYCAQRRGLPSYQRLFAHCRIARSAMALSMRRAHEAKAREVFKLGRTLQRSFRLRVRALRCIENFGSALTTKATRTSNSIDRACPSVGSRNSILFETAPIRRRP